MEVRDEQVVSAGEGFVCTVGDTIGIRGNLDGIYRDTFRTDVQALHDTGVVFTATPDFVRLINVPLLPLNEILADIPDMLETVTKVCSLSTWCGPGVQAMFEVIGNKTLTPPVVKHPGWMYEYDPAIIAEMISLVDKKRFRILMSIAGSNNSTSEFANAEVCDMYLDKWAKAKYRLYLMLGRKLSVSREIEYELTSGDIYAMVMDIAISHPYAAEILLAMSSRSFVKNELNDINFVKKSEVYRGIFTPGMKLSKFAESLYHNKELNDALSVLVGLTKGKSTIHLSIDPYDYLTMSISNHGWRSCHHIFDGEWCGGGPSYMLDMSSMIAHASTDTQYTFEFAKFKYKGASKSWRQLVNVSDSNFSALFGRQYPDKRDAYTKCARSLYEDCVDAFIDNHTAWKIRHDEIAHGYVDDIEANGEFAYWDIRNDCHFDFVHLPDYFAYTDIREIEVSTSVLYDVYDGEEIDCTCNYRLAG